MRVDHLKYACMQGGPHVEKCPLKNAPVFPQEYVASLIRLYKNHGAVSCVGIYFLFI